MGRYPALGIFCSGLFLCLFAWRILIPFFVKDVLIKYNFTVYICFFPVDCPITRLAEFWRGMKVLCTLVYIHIMYTFISLWSTRRLTVIGGTLLHARFRHPWLQLMCVCLSVVLFWWSEYQCLISQLNQTVPVFKGFVSNVCGSASKMTVKARSKGLKSGQITLVYQDQSYVQGGFFCFCFFLNQIFVLLVNITWT